MSGEVDLVFINVPAILAQVKAGRLRALAAAGARRSDLMPEVPTLKEAGSGCGAVGNTPEEFGSLLKEEVAKWREVVRASGLKVD